ncbi:MAG: hypothetical protein MUO26_09655, partial [Methanotrichaceae archaeon]|nr:hypothetical protein [Methanotrichaceae archaeon]
KCIIATYRTIVDSKIYANPLSSCNRFWIRLFYLNIKVASVFGNLKLIVILKSARPWGSENE